MGMCMKRLTPCEVFDHTKSKKCWKLDQRKRSHAVRWHHEVSAGNVHEEVDVAAVPAPEVVVLNEVQHLARRDAKGQKSNARLKDRGSQSRRSLQEKLKPEARKPHRRARTEAEVQHVLREGLKCLRQAKWQPGAAVQKCKQQVQRSAKPEPHRRLLAAVVREVGRQEARSEVEVEVGFVRNIRSAASEELREEHRRLKCFHHRSLNSRLKSKRRVDPPALRSFWQEVCSPGGLGEVTPRSHPRS